MLKRLVTSAIGVPLALAAVFLLPSWVVFVLTAALVTAGGLELVRLVRPRAPQAPLGALVILVPLAAAGLFGSLPAGGEAGPWLPAIAAAALLAAVVVGALVLLARTPVEQALLALGVLTFGVVYLAVPAASFAHLQRLDPWLAFLLLAIVWLGDTMAFMVGSSLGRRKLAPVVSPNKTWEGAVAGLLAGVVATVLWALWRLETVPLDLLALGTLTAAAAQVGDLVESLVKRGAGVKDSGDLLPGHGGFLDRLDAFLFAAPVMAAGLLVMDVEALVR